MLCRRLSGIVPSSDASSRHTAAGLPVAATPPVVKAFTYSVSHTQQQQQQQQHGMQQEQ
jgi:hypothetical protein